MKTCVEAEGDVPTEEEVGSSSKERKKTPFLRKDAAWDRLALDRGVVRVRGQLRGRGRRKDKEERGEYGCLFWNFLEKQRSSTFGFFKTKIRIAANFSRGMRV